MFTKILGVKIHSKHKTVQALLRKSLTNLQPQKTTLYKWQMIKKGNNLSCLDNGVQYIEPQTQARESFSA